MPPIKQKEVHRPLHLGTPITKGEDVTSLQQVIKKAFDKHEITWLPVTVDGVMGPQTLHAARFYTWVLGLGKGHREPIQKKHLITEETQKLIRSPEHRTNAQRRAAKRRQPRLAKIRKRQTEGTAAAVAGARASINIVENPAGSNTGPDRTITVFGKKVVVGVSAFQREFGLDGVFWCLCFACFWLKWAGAKIAGNCAFSVAIEGYARNHENGFMQVPLKDLKAGDLTIWKFDGPNAPSDHGELCVDDFDGTKFEDVGGNTGSDSSGSQSNGGGVFPKMCPGNARSMAQLSMCVRVLFK